MGKLLGRHTEFETKYLTNKKALAPFKNIVLKIPELINFTYVEGPDYYFTNKKLIKYFSGFKKKLNKFLRQQFDKILNKTIYKLPDFIRYRSPLKHFSATKELTTKYKKAANNNFNRKEKNIAIYHQDHETVKKFINDLGYELHFAVYKYCYIYNFPDANIVFYTVCTSKNTKKKHFIEIEIDEHLARKITAQKAWGIINKYEKYLKPIGIDKNKRLTKSLFEIYQNK